MALKRTRPLKLAQHDEKSVNEKRKADAYELAQILYDIFKEQQTDDGLIINGQNYANHSGN